MTPRFVEIIEIMFDRTSPFLDYPSFFLWLEVKQKCLEKEGS